MRYGVNLADLTKDMILAKFLVAPVCPNRIIYKVDKDRVDEIAIVLETDSETAEAIIGVIRLKYPVSQLRCYRNKQRI